MGGNLGLDKCCFMGSEIMAKLQSNSVDIEKWLGLIRADNVGATIFSKLIKHFGSADRALGASVSELAKVNGIGYKKAEQIAATRGKFDVTAELELAKSGRADQGK